MNKPIKTLIAAAVGLVSSAAMAAETVPVSLSDFVRAESDHMMRSTAQRFGVELGELGHSRTPTPLDKQSVIRMNRDTLYSVAILDLSQPATVTLPEIGGRYQSMQVTSQDHYLYAVAEPGTYTLTQQEAGSRYVMVSFRTLADASDAADVKLANQAQDKIVVDTPVKGGDYAMPQWNMDQLREIRSTLNSLLPYGSDASRSYGRKDEVDPVSHLLGTAVGWGALPPQSAMYFGRQVAQNDGNTAYSLTVEAGAPVDAFWSITVYNREGYMEENSLGHYSFNNITAAKSSDGSVTINFGNCDDGRLNCLPLTEDWNYTVRLYEPGQAILDGEWEFPEPVEVK